MNGNRSKVFVSWSCCEFIITVHSYIRSLSRCNNRIM